MLPPQRPPHSRPYLPRASTLHGLRLFRRLSLFGVGPSAQDEGQNANLPESASSGIDSCQPVSAVGVFEIAVCATVLLGRLSDN